MTFKGIAELGIQSFGIINAVGEYSPERSLLNSTRCKPSSKSLNLIEMHSPYPELNHLWQKQETKRHAGPAKSRAELAEVGHTNDAISFIIEVRVVAGL